MQLTKQTDFAFRTLLYLARLPKGELSSIHDVCDFYDVSPNHISKVVVKLGHLGYIRTVRGKGGGIALSETALGVSLAEVVSAFESTLEPVNCEEPACRLAPDCRLKGVLDDAMQAFVAVLRQYTLADLLNGDVEPVTIQSPGGQQA